MRGYPLPSAQRYLQILVIHSLAIRLVLAARHCLRVAVVALCVLTFAAGAAQSDRLGVVIGTLVGLFFGIVFAFGDELADALEK